MYDRVLNQNNLAIEEPYYQETLAVEDQKQRTHMINVFHDIDKKVLDKYNIPRRFDTREEIENMQETVLTKKVIRDIAVKKQKLTNENKRLREENKLRNTTPDMLDENKQKIKDNILKWNALEHETNQINKIKGKLN